MDISGVTPHPFRLLARVPEDMVSLPADGDWAAWVGAATVADAASGRDAVILVSITVTAFDPPPARAVGEVLVARLRTRHTGETAHIEEFAVPGDNPAVVLRTVTRHRLGRRYVATGQAQALVAYPAAGALGVVSGVALDPDDLDRAAALVTDIAARMTVTVATAAA
jgi:hypothetical protein